MYNEYLAIIKPNEPVKSDLKIFKKICKDEYGWASSPAHFTVFNLLQPTSNEKRFIQCFERNISNFSPFQIDLFGFNYFSGSTCTLYVRLKEENEFSKLVRYIRKFCKPILRPVKNYSPHYNTNNAHLTVAKGILISDFLKIWPSWKNLQYQSSTTADRIFLLKRPFTETNSNYEIIGEYSFLGQDTQESQMTLF